MKSKFTCSKLVSSLNTLILKTTLLIHIISCITLENAPNCPCNFQNKVLKVGRKNQVSHALTISIIKAWPTQFLTKFKSLNQGSNMKANILWALNNLKLSMKLRKGLNIIATCNCMLAPSCFTLMHMSTLCITSTFVCNINLSLKSWTYNPIFEAKALDNNQQLVCQLITHVVITRDNASQIALAIAQDCAKGILLVRAFASDYNP